MSSDPVVQPRTPLVLLSVKEFAEVLGIGLDKARELLDSGEVACVRLGPRTRRVHPDDLAAYIQRQTIPAKADRAIPPPARPAPARPILTPEAPRRGRCGPRGPQGPWRLRTYEPVTTHT